MSAPDVYLFRFIGETIENAIAHYVTPAIDNIIGVVGPTALVGVTLYIAILGALVIAGYLSNPFWDVVKTCVKIAFIAAIGLSAGNYLTWVVGSVNDIQTGLAGALNTLGGPPPDSIYQSLDNALGKAFDMVGKCFKHADESGFMEIGTALGWMFSGVSIAAGGVGFTLLGGAIIIVAKVALTALFAIGPLFIACLMWPATARFFDSWFSQVMNYVFTIVFASLFVSLSLAIFDHFISGQNVALADSGNGIYSPAFAALQILTLSGILAFLIFKSGEFAAGVAGGVSMAALSLRQMVSPVTATASAVSGGAASAGKIINPVSNRLDPKTGLQTSSSRAEHLYMGRTILNPAYRKAVTDHRLENRGSNTVKGK